MINIKGKSVSDGIAIGQIHFLNKKVYTVDDIKTENPQKELEIYENAVTAAESELDILEKTTLSQAGEESSQIFQIHKMMLRDRDFSDEVQRLILNSGYNARYAVKKSADALSQMLASSDNDYMKDRVADIRDISQRLIRILSGDRENAFTDSDCILCADDLTPSEAVGIGGRGIVAIATRFGSAQSHTAILARTMNIPALIGLGEILSEEYEGMLAVADGYKNSLYIDPTPDILEKARKQLRLDIAHRERLNSLVGMDNITLDGTSISIFANIGTPDDIETVKKNDGGGIGLFRSEFLYLKNQALPTEEEQFSAYKKVLSEMNPKKVIIRTMDIGADKYTDYLNSSLNIDKEENPALGYRAVRICLSQRDIFKTQLRALLRASAFGKLSIMIPMITSLEEIKETRLVLNEVKTELRASGIDFDGETELGIMIETPAAVMISDLLAREVDFFSIGTNDLTQYALAIDRQNPKLEPFYNPHHTAVIRMIKQTAENAHKARIWCGICGELAADLSMTETFLSLGIDELSVSPNHILPLREKIRSLNLNAVKDDILSGI